MEHRALTHSTVSDHQVHSAEPHHEGHGTWVLTIYASTGLALLGVLAYYFSRFLTH